MTPVQVGIIGAGNVSVQYLTAARFFRAFEVAALADLDPARTKARADEYGVPKALSVDELLADPDVQVVINLTIPGAHVSVSQQILEAGKAAYSEKPLGTVRADAAAMIALADQRGLRVGCAPDTFLGAGLQSARKALDDGLIGEPLGAFASVLSRGMEMWHPDPTFFYQPGAGPLFDLGPYYLTALVHLLGPISKVAATAKTSFAERTVTSQPNYGMKIPVGTPTHISALLSFESGVAGTLITSFDVWASEQPKFELYGSTGTLRLAAPNLFGGPVWVHGEVEGWEEKALVHPYTSLETGWSIALADFAFAIQEGRPHRADGRFALHALEVMQACLKSAEMGQAVAVESRCERPEPLWPGVDGGLL